MELTATEVGLACYAVRDVCSRHRLGLVPSVPIGLLALEARLLSSFARATERPCSVPELEESDLVDANGAAQIIGCTTQWVRKIHSDLDGQKVGRDWVFRRRDVVAYAAARKGS